MDRWTKTFLFQRRVSQPSGYQCIFLSIFFPLTLVACVGSSGFSVVSRCSTTGMWTGKLLHNYCSISSLEHPCREQFKWCKDQSSCLTGLKQTFKLVKKNQIQQNRQTPINIKTQIVIRHNRRTREGNKEDISVLCYFPPKLSSGKVWLRGGWHETWYTGEENP